jgi:hypothetical protein
MRSFRQYILFTGDLEAFFTLPEWHMFTRLNNEELQQIAIFTQEVCNRYVRENLMNIAGSIIQQDRKTPGGELNGFSLGFLALIIFSGLSPRLCALIEDSGERAGILYRILKYSQQENATRLEADSPRTYKGS